MSTKESRDEIRQLLTDVLSAHANDMNGRFNVMHTQLIHIKEEITDIKEQVTKANGRTKILETEVDDIRLKELAELETIKLKELEHILRCPQLPRIDKLEKKEIGRSAIVKFILLAATLAGTIGGLVVAGLKHLFESN